MRERKISPHDLFTRCNGARALESREEAQEDFIEHWRNHHWKGKAKNKDLDVKSILSLDLMTHTLLLPNAAGGIIIFEQCCRHYHYKCQRDKQREIDLANSPIGKYIQLPQLEQGPPHTFPLAESTN
jgi:hypothetical protein